jgi:serine/threonine protein kinase
MHRNGRNTDLKFENVVGFRNVLNPRFVGYKVTDFGTAAYGFGRDGKCYTYANTFSGSPFTMPPEVTETPYNVFLHDSYSLGVILYELSHNRQFPHPPNSEIDWNLKDEWLMAHNKKRQLINKEYID